MYVGIITLMTILEEDSHCIDWFLVESINDNRSEIKLSNGNKFTVNASIRELFNVISKLTRYSLPPIDDVVFKFVAINRESLLHVNDEHIVFEDTIYENMYENASILVECYELPFECIFNGN